jgi:hypothetical protein
MISPSVIHTHCVQDIESLQSRKMKEMEELFRIQSVKERCLNDLEKARMEMAYIESFRQLPPFTPSLRQHPPAPPSSALPAANSTASTTFPRPHSAHSAAGVLGQPPKQQLEVPRLLMAQPQSGTQHGGGAPSGQLAKHHFQQVPPGGRKSSEQDYVPLMGKCYSTKRF